MYEPKLSKPIDANGNILPLYIPILLNKIDNWFVIDFGQIFKMKHFCIEHILYIGCSICTCVIYRQYKPYMHIHKLYFVVIH